MWEDLARWAAPVGAGYAAFAMITVAAQTDAGAWIPALSVTTFLMSTLAGSMRTSTALLYVLAWAAAWAGGFVGMILMALAQAPPYHTVWEGAGLLVVTSGIPYLAVHLAAAALRWLAAHPPKLAAVTRRVRW